MALFLRRVSPAALLTILGAVLLGGCVADGERTADRPAPPRASVDPDCALTALMLTVSRPTIAAGATLTVTTAPEGCPVTETWEGEVVVRSGDRDTPTGSRIEIAEPGPVDVRIPNGLIGKALVMLVPDRDCEAQAATADCHYPYAEITVEAPSS